MKIFVTGVGGQLGFDLMKELEARGYDAIGSDILDNCNFKNYIKLDITDKKQVEKVVCDIDGGNVVVNRGVAPATNLIGMAEKYLNIEEDLELGSGQPSVRYSLCRLDCCGFSGRRRKYRKSKCY